MIRLPKLFKRKARSDDPYKSAVGSRLRTTKKTSSRGFQRIAAEGDEQLLTEDPEQQRARHRLIGAAVLVLIAIIGLPRIMDSKPKLVSNDIAVNIVATLPGTSISTPSEVKTPPQVNSQTVTPPPKDAVSAPSSRSKGAGGSAVEEANQTRQLVTSPASNTLSPVRNLGLVAGEEVVSNPLLQSNAPKNVDSSSGTALVKYVIQIGAFSSDERAQGWIAKLKEQKIPNYVLNKNGVDGVKLYVLRAGPFNDKEAAEVAEKKIKAMGLNPRLVEVGKS